MFQDKLMTWAKCDEAVHSAVPNVLSPRNLVLRPNLCNRKAMNRNWSNQKANPALKTKTGNK